MSELKPWSEDPASSPEAPEAEPKSGYLLAAGILAGLVIAIGCQALLGHFALRPELAAADPLMASLLQWGRWGGWLLSLGSGLGWVFSLRR